MSRRWRVVGAALLAAAAVIWALAALQQRSAAADRAVRGQALFRGEAALDARLTGHEQALPAIAARCLNCHQTPNTAPLTAASSAAVASEARPYAGRLDADALLKPRARRGGPPSRFDEAGFCTLLRTGVDPAQVLLPVTMPRYEIGAQDCRDLWSYLTQRRETP